MKAVDESRETIQKFLGAANHREIIFTGSATEANNLAIQGIAGSSEKDISSLPQVITTKIEHPSVLEPIRALEAYGKIEAVYLAVDKEGLISLEELKRALDENTILVSIGYANSEIGVIQPIQKAVKRVKEFNPRIIFHTDAVQAIQFLESDVQKLGADLMTISAHKIYGPKGIGVLYVRDGIRLEPVIYGGGQEYGLRSGTENVPLIVGFAKAIEILKEGKSNQKNIEKIKSFRNYLWEELQAAVPGISINGSLEHRLPNNLNIFIPNVDSEIFLIAFSEAGICVSSGSACASRSQKPSHVIEALGRNTREGCHLRITLGRQTNRQELDQFLKELIALLQEFGRQVRA